MRHSSFLLNELQQIHASVQQLCDWQKKSPSSPQHVKTSSPHFLKEAEQLLRKLTTELKPLVHAVQPIASFWRPLVVDDRTEPPTRLARSLVYTRK
jgi:hypothetical protein